MNVVTARAIVLLVLAHAMMGAVPARGAAAFEAVVVVVDVKRIAQRGDATLRTAQVRVTDLRSEAGRKLERTTIGATSMGAIYLDPPAPDLVQGLIEAKADEVLARHFVVEPRTIHCGIFVFEIATPATVLYWDVRARIEMGLRVEDRERTISAAATERTFVWQSTELLTRVTNMALERMLGEAEQALEELLMPPR